MILLEKKKKNTNIRLLGFQAFYFYYYFLRFQEKVFVDDL